MLNQVDQASKRQPGKCVHVASIHKLLSRCGAGWSPTTMLDNEGGSGREATKVGQLAQTAASLAIGIAWMAS